MPYAVELLFDEEGEARVRRIWEALKAAGLGAYMVESGSIPHITLAVYDSPSTSDTGNLSRIAEIRFFKRLGEFAARWAPFAVNFGSVGAFPQSGTVFLAPIPSEDLLMIHRHFHCSFDDFEANGWKYYKPSLWVPHCTLSANAEDSAVPEVIRLVLGKFRPFRLRLLQRLLSGFSRQYAWLSLRAGTNRTWKTLNLRGLCLLSTYVLYNWAPEKNTAFSRQVRAAAE